MNIECKSRIGAGGCSRVLFNRFLANFKMGYWSSSKNKSIFVVLKGKIARLA